MWLLFKLLDASQRVIVVRPYSKSFWAESFNLVRTSWSFPEYCEPILQMPMSPANVGFSRRTLAAAKKCSFENRFLGELAEK